MTKAVLIPINEAPKVIDLKSDGDISEAVGGFIQGVYPDVPGSILYLNIDRVGLGLYFRFDGYPQVRGLHL